MPTTTATGVDVAKLLAGVLADIEGLRVYAHVADIARVPCAVVQLPSLDYADPTGGFGHAVWSFPILILVARNSDLEAQQKLSQFTNQVAAALWDADVDGVASIEPQQAVPATVTLAGSDLPAYNLRVQVRA